MYTVYSINGSSTKRICYSTYAVSEAIHSKIKVPSNAKYTKHFQNQIEILLRPALHAHVPVNFVYDTPLKTV